MLPKNSTPIKVLYLVNTAIQGWHPQIDSHWIESSQNRQKWWAFWGAWTQNWRDLFWSFWGTWSAEQLLCLPKVPFRWQTCRVIRCSHRPICRPILHDHYFASVNWARIILLARRAFITGLPLHFFWMTATLFLFLLAFRTKQNIIEACLYCKVDCPSQ